MIRVKVDMDAIAEEIRRLETAIPEAHRDLQAELIGYVIDDLVNGSPVLTGAYRASHAVGTGADMPTKLVYDSPEHTPPEVLLTPGAQPYPQVPDGALARKTYESEAPFQRAVLFNDRPYAAALEWGTSTTSPRAIYAAAEATADLIAENLADRGGVL